MARKKADQKPTTSPSKPDAKKPLPRKARAGRKKIGQPSEYQLRKELFLDAIREGNYRNTSAAVAGVTPQTICKWINDEPGFEEELLQAEAVSESSAVREIRSWAKCNWQAAAWYLERKFPDRWGKKDQLSINNIDLSGFTTEELAELREYLITQKASGQGLN